MYYGATPTNPLELLVLATGQAPLPLLDGLFSLMKTRAIMAGVKLGVFEALAARPLPAAAVAAARGLDPESCALLLRALVFSGYLEQDGELFALSRLGRDSFLPGAAKDFRGYLLWNYTQWELVQHLETLVKEGRGLDFHHTLADPEAWAHYQRAMAEFAREDAPRVAKSVPLRPGARRVLDLAGGHGTFGAAICRRQPGMRSVVVDLPAALPAGRALAAEMGHGELVEHRAGNLLTDDFETGNDVVVLSHILHHFRPDQNLEVLRKAHGALEDGGTVVIWEIEAPDPKRSKADLGDGAALYFRLTSNARAYHADDYRGWLAGAGFAKIRVCRPLLSPGGLLLTARKPASPG
jgi:2-polyprenyl-3-methyl-5-hydroxy-6-metoxy-1,4-benzoquinol methylase